MVLMTSASQSVLVVIEATPLAYAAVITIYPSEFVVTPGALVERVLISTIEGSVAMMLFACAVVPSSTSIRLL